MPKVVVTLDDGDIKMALAEYVQKLFPSLTTGLVTLIAGTVSPSSVAVTATVACSQRESSSPMDR